jgi:phosphoenolpyruvate synthase/pyruvate phosphate dikinase
MMFIDYNRILGSLYENFQGQAAATGTALVTGQASSPGKVTGKVRLVHPEDLATTKLAPNEILVCRMTTPDYLPLMQQAAAIVTDLGGILSHAAIVARELGKPCLTATGNATTVLKPGHTVTVDADAGLVRAA